MSERLEFAIIGAGPAGLAAAVAAAELGIAATVLDEQTAPGGQIYRNVEAVADGRSSDLELLGRDYARGLDLVRRFRESGARYWPESTVFEIKAGGWLGVLRDGAARIIAADEILLACGAMERPVPISGWTLPGVISVGAAQTLLKASNVISAGPTVIAGNGPLIVLVAWQLARAGVKIEAVLRTAPRRQFRAALPYLPSVAFNGELWKGFGWLRELRRLGVRQISDVTMLAAEGEGQLESVRFSRGDDVSRIQAETLLLHEGVVPNLQLTRAAGCRHLWDDGQRCWRPETDAFGATSIEGLAVAGDCAGIGGHCPRMRKRSRLRVRHRAAWPLIVLRVRPASILLFQPCG